MAGSTDIASKDGEVLCRSSPFQTDPEDGDVRLRRIFVRAGQLIDRVYFDYSDGTTNDIHIGYGGKWQVPFTLSRGEYIVEMSGKCGWFLHSLCFHTNLGRRSMCYGGGWRGRQFDYKAQPSLQIWSFACSKLGRIDQLEQRKIAPKRLASSKVEASAKTSTAADVVSSTKTSSANATSISAAPAQTSCAALSDEASGVEDEGKECNFGRGGSLNGALSDSHRASTTTKILDTSSGGTVRNGGAASVCVDEKVASKHPGLTTTIGKTDLASPLLATRATLADLDARRQHLEAKWQALRSKPSANSCDNDVKVPVPGGSFKLHTSARAHTSSQSDRDDLHAAAALGVSFRQPKSARAHVTSQVNRDWNNAVLEASRSKRILHDKIVTSPSQKLQGGSAAGGGKPDGIVAERVRSFANMATPSHALPKRPNSFHCPLPSASFKATIDHRAPESQRSKDDAIAGVNEKLVGAAGLSFKSHVPEKTPEKTTTDGLSASKASSKNKCSVDERARAAEKLAAMLRDANERCRTVADGTKHMRELVSGAEVRSEMLSRELSAKEARLNSEMMEVARLRKAVEERQATSSYNLRRAEQAERESFNLRKNLRGVEDALRRKPFPTSTCSSEGSFDSSQDKTTNDVRSHDHALKQLQTHCPGYVLPGVHVAGL